MLLPPAQPDLLSLPLFISTLLPHTRRKRILALALHVQSQGPKQADHLWMPSFLPSSSSSSGIMLEEPPPQVEKMLLWACSMYTHKVSTSPPLQQLDYQNHHTQTPEATADHGFVRATDGPGPVPAPRSKLRKSFRERMNLKAL